MLPVPRRQATELSLSQAAPSRYTNPEATLPASKEHSRTSESDEQEDDKQYCDMQDRKAS
jgi:hypothetical protein